MLFLPVSTHGTKVKCLQEKLSGGIGHFGRFARPEVVLAIDDEVLFFQRCRPLASRRARKRLRSPQTTNFGPGVMFQRLPVMLETIGDTAKTGLRALLSTASRMTISAPKE